MLSARAANTTLAHDALHALKWRYVGTAIQVGLRFVIGIALARLLSPAEFGVVAMALIPIGFASLLGDLGFAVAIIQRPRITPKHVRTAFTGAAIMSMMLFLMLWFLAPTVSHFFAQNSLIPILRIIGVSFIFSGMSAVPVCLLRRELKFRTIAVIETSSYVVGYGVAGVPLAVLGYGVWSLVAANIIQSLCLLFFAVHSIKQPLWPYFGVQEYRDLVQVALAEVLNNVTNYLAENLDSFVIGKWLGTSSLGLYNRSFYLMRLPVLQFSAGLSSVMFPLYSRIQGDAPRLRRAYLHTVSLTTVFTMPIFFGMAAAPEIIISALFGEEWKLAAGVLRILCLSGPFWAILYIGGAVSHARGRVLNEWVRQAVYLAVMVIAMWFLIPLGIEGIALAVGFATLTRYSLLAHLAVRLTEISWKQFFVAQQPGFLVGITVFATVYLAKAVGSLFATSEILQLFVITIMALLSFIITFLLFPPSWFGDLYPWINEKFSVNLPCWLRKIIAAKALTMQG
jgi:PST family polysaccharide transporter